MLHPAEYAAPCWAILDPTPYWDTLYPAELRCPLLSYAATCWATLHPTELRCTLISYAAP
jgi:hypothetical protein